MRTVLVTGGTGFLGKRLVGLLLRQGLAVRCLVRPTSDVHELLEGAPPEHRERLSVFPGNLSRIDSCRKSVEGCDAVFHLAAEMAGATSVLFLNNVVATRHLVEGASRAGVRRFVLVSSLGVYGTGHLSAGEVLDEACPLDPAPQMRDPYSYSKIAQEQVAWDAYRERALPLVVIRPGVISGPGRSCLSNRVGLRLGKFLVKMGGSQPLPYTFVENCALAVAQAGTVPGLEGEAFNVVDDDPPTARALLKEYQRAVGKVRVLPVGHWAIPLFSWLCEKYHQFSKGMLPAVLTRYKSMAQWKPLRYSNAKAKAGLGWKPQTDFAEGLKRTFSWLRENPRFSAG